MIKKSGTILHLNSNHINVERTIKNQINLDNQNNIIKNDLFNDQLNK